MARGKDGPRTDRALDGHSGSRAAIVALLLLLALPLAAAEPAPSPHGGPAVTRVDVVPTPVLPGPVAVFATSTSLGPPILAMRFYVDDPFSGLARAMVPIDGAFDSTDESGAWTGTYDDFGPGWHTVYVQAMDGATWGAFFTRTFRAEDPVSFGPVITGADVSPLDVARGEAITIRAFITDPFAAPPDNSYVAAAEFFVDRFGPDGAGTPMTGSFGGRLAIASWTGVLVLPPGEHTVWVHGRNVYGSWGVAASVMFTARSPSFTLRLVADRDTARPGETVTYTVDFENRGNAAATAAWLNVTLPASLMHLDDTVADAGGTRLAGTSYRFVDVAPGNYSFTLRASVRDDAVDGAPLTAAADLDFTNANWDFTPVTAIASGTVIAPELRIAITAPARAFAGETVILSVQLDNIGSRAIPSVDVALDGSAWTSPASDTAAEWGGEPRGASSWRFADVPAGPLIFEVIERVNPGAPDGEDATRTVRATFVSRLGGTETVEDAASFVLGRPSLGIRVVADRTEVVAGERVALAVEVENVGSEAAGTAWVNLTLPSGLALVAGDAPTLSDGGVHSWRLDDVPLGVRPLTVVLEARVVATMSIAFDLAYTSPGGAFLGRASAPTAITVLAPPPAPASLPYVAFGTVAASAAAASLLATERGKSALFLFAVPLYTRLRKEKVLDNETRGMIRGYILANPGDHYNAIKQTLELPNGTLAYHLNVLEKQMIVRSVKDGKFRRYYPAEMRVPEGGEPTKIQRVVLDLIQENPGVTPRDIAGLLGLTSSTVSYHLEKLKELGLIRSRREGISKHLYIEDDGDN